MHDRHHHRRGQAMIELAAGILSLALLLSAICAFAAAIPESTRMQNLVRRLSGCNAQTSGGESIADLPERIRDNLPLTLQQFPAVEIMREEMSYGVKLDELGTQYFSGGDTLKLHEHIIMPIMGIPQIPASSIIGEEGLL